MNEQIIIQSFLKSRDFFNQHRHRFEGGNSFGLGAAEVFNEAVKYYDADSSAESVNKDILLERVEKRYPKNKELISSFLHNLPDDISEKNVSKLILEKEQETLAYEAASLVSQNKYDQALSIMKKCLELEETETQEDDRFYHKVPVNDLVEKLSGENLIHIAPSVLSDHLGGGLPRQSQIGVFARPDVGKSAFCVNMAVRMCQEGYKVLYFGNEDSDMVMLSRILCRFNRVEREDLFADPERYTEQALENGYENFMFKSLHPGTLWEIEQEIEVRQPDVIFVDQVRNLFIKGHSDDSMTNVLLRGAERCRSFAKRFNLLSVLVTQAGEEAHNKPVLNMTDVEYSNTGFAAQLDLLIGIGQDQQLKMQNAAVLSFPKNKGVPISPFRIKIDYAKNLIGTEYD